MLIFKGLFKMKKVFLLFIILCLQIQTVYAFLDKVDGLEYVVRKIEEPPINKSILQRFDLYELYFENRTDKAFSIPGYSVDFDVDYSDFSDVTSFTKDKSSKKLTVLNVATGAASIAFGGLVKSAATTARSIGNFRKQGSSLKDERSFLANDKIFIIYPKEALSLYFFIDKFSAQPPSVIKYICRDETQNYNYVIVNKHLDLRILDAMNEESSKEENVIAVPESQQYK